MGSLPPPSRCPNASLPCPVVPPMPCETLVRLRRPLRWSLSFSFSPSAFPPASPSARALATIPYRRPSPSWAPCFSISLTAACSLGLSEARPLVFLLFPSRLRLLLVITTNLSRINSPSGINSSTVQAEKEKVIARVGAGNSPPCRAPRIRLAALCPLRRKRKEI